MTEFTEEFEIEVRSKINPYYAVQKGTESYERRVLLDEIDRLRGLLNNSITTKKEDILFAIKNYLNKIINDRDFGYILRRKMDKTGYEIVKESSSGEDTVIAEFKDEGLAANAYDEIITNLRAASIYSAINPKPPTPP